MLPSSISEVSGGGIFSECGVVPSLSAAFLYLIVVIFLHIMSYNTKRFLHKIQSGGLSRQATTSNILLEDFVSIREAIDKLNSCSGASTIESKEWTTCIEEEIASLNNKLQQHETIRTRAREEVGSMRRPCG